MVKGFCLLVVWKDRATNWVVIQSENRAESGAVTYQAPAVQVFRSLAVVVVLSHMSHDLQVQSAAEGYGLAAAWHEEEVLRKADVELQAADYSGTHLWVVEEGTVLVEEVHGLEGLA